MAYFILQRHSIIVQNIAFLITACKTKNLQKYFWTFLYALSIVVVLNLLECKFCTGISLLLLKQTILTTLQMPVY